MMVPTMEMDMNDNPASPRAALVTGATGGMGSAIAARLAADGIAVGIHYGGRRMPAEELAAKIAAGGGHSVVVSGDVADEHAMAEAFEQIERAFGGLDVVVNTAGIMVLAPLEKFDLVELDRMHRTNIRGTFVVSQQAARRVRSGGAIVNVSTSVVRTQLPGYGAYVASKAAVEGLTLILARELRGRDVTVNAVAPGPTATPLFLDGKEQSVVDHLTNMARRGRLGP